VAWNRLPRTKKKEANRPPPKNLRQERISQALYNQVPRKDGRLILDTGTGDSD
jgi:hypothetical protein